MSLAQEVREEEVREEKSFEHDEEFIALASTLWKASLALHNACNRLNGHFGPNARSADMGYRRDWFRRTTLAEQDLRRWLQARGCSQDRMDKLVHYIKKNAVQLPSGAGDED